MIQQLLQRRVPQIAGLYVAGAWGFVQFVDWAVHQYALSPDLVNFVVTLLLLLLPSVAWLAWRHGAPGRVGWGASDGGAVLANLAVAAGVLVLAFAGKELGAATTVKLVEDDQGNVVERVVPKAAFRRELLGFQFDNTSGAGDLEWLRYAFDLGLWFDLSQDLFVRHVSDDHPFVYDLLAEAGIAEGAPVPLALKRRAAEGLDIDHFLEGEYRTEGDTLVVTTRLYETRNARRVSERAYRAADPLEIVDRISVDVRTDLGIPDWQIEGAVDLPASELLTESPEALRALAEVYPALGRSDLDFPAALAAAEAATALDSTAAAAHYLAGMVSAFMGDNATARVHLDAMERYAWRLPERMRLQGRMTDQSMVQSDAASAARTGSYWAEIYPQDPEARRALAEVYQMMGDSEAEIAQHRALLALDPTDVEAMRNISFAFRAREEYDSALAYLRLRGARLPKDVQNRLDVAGTFWELGDLPTVRSELEQARVAAPGDFDVLRVTARFDLREGRHAEAERLAEEAKPFARSNLERYFLARLEETLAYDRGRFRRLEDAYRRTLPIAASTMSPIALVQQMAGSELLLHAAEAGRETAALRQLDSLRALVGEPWSHAVESAAIRIHIDRGDVAAARASLEKLRALRGGGFGAYYVDEVQPLIVWSEGRIAELEEGGCAGALARYDEALELEPLVPMFRLERARCLRTLRRLDDAEPEIEWLLARFPGLPQARVEAARFHAARGEREEALAHLDAALETWADSDPEYVPAREARALREELARGD